MRRGNFRPIGPKLTTGLPKAPPEERFSRQVNARLDDAEAGFRKAIDNLAKDIKTKFGADRDIGLLVRSMEQVLEFIRSVQNSDWVKEVDQLATELGKIRLQVIEAARSDKATAEAIAKLNARLDEAKANHRANLKILTKIVNSLKEHAENNIAERIAEAINTKVTYKVKRDQSGVITGWEAV